MSGQGPETAERRGVWCGWWPSVGLVMAVGGCLLSSWLPAMAETGPAFGDGVSDLPAKAVTTVASPADGGHVIAMSNRAPEGLSRARFTSTDVMLVAATALAIAGTLALVLHRSRKAERVAAEDDADGGDGVVSRIDVAARRPPHASSDGDHGSDRASRGG
jgi:hypothetical protein